MERKGKSGIWRAGAKAGAAWLVAAIGGPIGAFVGTVFGEIAGFLLGGPSGPNILDDPLRKRLTHDFPPSLLLRPEYQAVDFIGREDLIADLDAWYAAEVAFAVRLYIGPGGIGKTRLFVELCGRLKGTGWTAGFLTSRDGRLSPNAIDTLLADNSQVLIVVDYAETRRAVLSELLVQVAEVRDGAKIRLILLARSAGDWWTELVKSDAVIQSLLMTAPEPIELPPVASGPISRDDVFDRSTADFARALRKEVPNFTRPDLSAVAFGTVLFIQIAALAALDGQRIEDADALLDFILDHERRYWRKQARSRKLPEELDGALDEAVVLLTLARSVADRKSLEALISKAPLLSGQLPARIKQLGRLVTDLYAEGERIVALGPDLLGEHQVFREALRDDTLLTAYFEGIDEAGGGAGLTVLTRLAARRADA